MACLDKYSRGGGKKSAVILRRSCARSSRILGFSRLARSAGARLLGWQASNRRTDVRGIPIRNLSKAWLLRGCLRGSQKPGMYNKQGPHLSCGCSYAMYVCAYLRRDGRMYTRIYTRATPHMSTRTCTYEYLHKNMDLSTYLSPSIYLSV